MARLIKYMGSADEKIINGGENWGGRLAEPLNATLVFKQENNFIVDVEGEGVSEAAQVLLLEDPNEFVDVTGLELVPTNENERYFKGVPEAPFASRSDGHGREVYRSLPAGVESVVPRKFAELMSERLGSKEQQAVVSNQGRTTKKDNGE